jgi:hypothetical protein
MGWKFTPQTLAESGDGVKAQSHGNTDAGGMIEPK